MTDPSDDRKFMGIQAAHTERTRTPEFKATREKLVEDVNGWLQVLKDKRDKKLPLADGSLIGTDPRIKTTDLGSAFGFVRSMGEELKQGVSLTGDGITEALVFQSVSPTEDRKAVEIITVQGSDPVARAVRGNEYGPEGQTEVIASFGFRSKTSEEEQYFKYDISGNGSIRQQFLDPAGVHTSRRIENVEDLALAQAAFDQIKATAGN